MGGKSHGPRRRTRSKLTKPTRKKGKISIALSIQDFKSGDRVVVKPEPAVQKGMPNKRFFGKSGVVKSRKGKAYVLSMKDGDKTKEVISLPIHLKRV